jgi:hypothetical protein
MHNIGRVWMGQWILLGEFDNFLLVSIKSIKINGLCLCLSFVQGKEMPCVAVT